MGLIIGFRILMVLAVSFAALGSEILDWKNCLTETRKNNSELETARQNLRSFDSLSKGSYSGFYPQLTGILDSTTSQAGAAGTSTVYTAKISATANLFSGLSDQAKVEQAKANFRSFEQDMRIANATVSFELKTAFAALVYAQDAIKLTDDIRKRREENLKMVDLRFQSGQENKGSVLLSRAYLEQAELENLQAKDSIFYFQSQLSKVLGRESDPEISVKNDLPLNNPPSSMDFLKETTETPDFLQSVAKEELAQANLKAARSGFFPTLNLSGSVGNADTNFFPQTSQWSLGATLTFPLFSGFKDYHATESARSLLYAASATRQNTKRNLTYKLKQTYYAFVEAVQKLKADQSFYKAAVARAEIARSKYRSGLITFDDWDVIENDLIAREKNYLQSQRDRITAEATWEQSLGRGAL